MATDMWWMVFGMFGVQWVMPRTIMDLWERVIEHGLKHETTISDNQFGFMPGRSTMEVIFLDT
jgi:hypothetical protein